MATNPQTDADVVHAAYGDIVGKLVGVMFDAIRQADGDAAKKDAAVARFKAGLALARETKARATAAL